MRTEKAPTGEVLEREDEIARATAVVDEAAAGRGRLVAFLGEPGIGKTTLLQAVAAEQRRKGMCVISARASQFERAFSFALARQIVEPLIRSADEDERARLLSDAAGLAAPVVAVPGDGPPPAAGELFAVLHGLYWLCVNASERKPLLLVIDDLHWADSESLRFLAYLGARLDGIPIAVVIAARNAEPGADVETLTSVLHESPALLIRPGPLSERAIEELARRDLHADPEPPFVAALAAATGGNPFLLHELLALIQGEGTPPTAEAARRVGELGPPAIARAVVLRIARLPPACASLARALAVVGPKADLGVAAQLAGLDEPSAADAADALVGAQVLRPGEPLEFMHPILRAAVHDDVPPLKRAGMHRQAAQLLSAQGARADLVAGHLLATPPARDGWACGILQQAARIAIQQGAMEAAAKYLGRALEEPPPPDAVPSLLLQLGQALGVTRDPEFRTVLRRAVEQAPEPAQTLEAGLLAAVVLGFAGFHADAVEICQLAERKANVAAGEAVLRLDAELIPNAMQHPGTADLARERLERSLANAQVGSATEALLTLLLGTLKTLVGDPAEATVALIEPVIPKALEHDSLAVNGAQLSLIWNERLETAHRMGSELVERARQRGARNLLGAHALWRSLGSLRAGLVTEAVIDVREAHEWNRTVATTATSLSWSLAFLTDALVEQNELKSAEALQLDLVTGEETDSLSRALLAESRGRLRLAQGRLDEARNDLLDAGRRFDALGYTGPGLTAWRSDAARALAALGDGEEAKRLAAEHLKRARRVGTPGIVGQALATCGVVEGGALGIELRREAVASLEQSPARLEHARTLVDLGASLRRAGHRRDCRAPLKEGMAMARRGGAIAIAERAYTELCASGARPRKVIRSGVEALTPSERRVAQMAAEERSNKEIAQLLFITVKTVESHLRQAYQKLEIGSREELPRALQR